MDARSPASYSVLLAVVALGSLGCAESSGGGLDGGDAGRARDAGSVGRGIRIEGDIGAYPGVILPASLTVAVLVQLADPPTRYRVHTSAPAGGTHFGLDVAGAPDADTFELEGYVRGQLLAFRSTATLPLGVLDDFTVRSDLIGGASTATTIVYKRAGASGASDPWLADFPDDSWACGGAFTTMAGSGGGPDIHSLTPRDCAAIALAILTP